MILLFDMGGVVASSNCTSNICKELSITPEELLFFQLDKSGRNTYLQLTTGALSTSEYWNNFSLNSGIDISCDYFYKCYEPQVDDKVIDFIKFLKKKGHRVICGTNTIDSHYRKHMDMGTYSVFDCVYSSHQMGLKKPDKKFFEQILDSECNTSDSFLFIDDLNENIDAALSVGIMGHVFTDLKSLKLNICNLVFEQ